MAITTLHWITFNDVTITVNRCSLLSWYSDLEPKNKILLNKKIMYGFNTPSNHSPANTKSNKETMYASRPFSTFRKSCETLISYTQHMSVNYYNKDCVSASIPMIDCMYDHAGMTRFMYTNTSSPLQNL